jgi:carbon-monoxide dehydrogenase large subunit
MILRRPVKWIEDRMEHFRASTHGRESVHRFRLAADEEETSPESSMTT